MLDSKTYSSTVTIASPGRINLIGEHIDYNGGHVLPAAIDKKITLKFRPSDRDYSEILSVNFGSSFTIDLNSLERSGIEWQNFVLGVVYHIDVLRPGKLANFDCIIESNLPLGSGISSSAALECGMAKGLNELFGLGLTDLEIITLSRDAEHTYVGTKCGIMDQFAVTMGQKDHLILLDCETLDYQLIPAKFEPYRVVLLNTNVSHSLASSEYNVRRDECQSALETIRKKHPQYQFLTEVPEETILAFKPVLPEKIFNRALYVTQENQRTLNAVKLLENNDLKEFGKSMYASHDGLQNLYQVSCKELDFLVEKTRDLDYVIGSRMMGGGFGGCTINLVHKDFVNEFVAKLSGAYQEAFHIKPTPIITNIDDGVKRV